MATHTQEEFDKAVLMYGKAANQRDELLATLKRVRSRIHASGWHGTDLVREIDDSIAKAESR